MKFKFITLAVALVVVFGTAAGVKYGVRQQKKHLADNGIHVQVEDWLCLIKVVSDGYTDLIRGPFEDGTYNYGIFQINSKYCSPTVAPGGECNIPCSRLLIEELEDAINCAHMIYDRSGFEAWEAWEKKCKGK